MIVTEFFRIREDGVVLNRTYSDIGMMIERDGARYSEALDPINSGREYTETDEPVEIIEEATITDYQSALKDLGVNFDE
jgi:hypothetical protein